MKDLSKQVPKTKGALGIDDRRIIELYLARDERAIRETELKYGRLIRSMAFNILGNDEDAEECANDVLLSAWNKIPPTEPDNFKAFICKITRNAALKKLRYYTAEKRSPSALISLSELEEILPDDKLPSSVSEGEISRLINEFLKAQKPEIRNVFIRRYWFFDSVNDISARYSFSESKVKSMLFHARNKLKKFLKKEGINI